MTGKKLGNYEVAEKLGEGGMGDFEQEARALGALNHPNILTIFE